MLRLGASLIADMLKLRLRLFAQFLLLLDVLATEALHEHIKLPVPLVGELLPKGRLSALQLGLRLLLDLAASLGTSLLQALLQLRELGAVPALALGRLCEQLPDLGLALGVLLGDCLAEPAVEAVAALEQRALVAPALRQEVRGAARALLGELPAKALELLAGPSPVHLTLLLQRALVLLGKLLPRLSQLHLCQVHELLALRIRGLLVPLLQAPPLLLALRQDSFDVRLQSFDGHLFDLLDFVLLPGLAPEPLSGHPVFPLPLKFLGGLLIEVLQLSLKLLLDNLQLLSEELAPLREFGFVIQQAVHELEVPLHARLVVPFLLVKLIFPLPGRVQHDLLLMFSGCLQRARQAFDRLPLVLHLNVQQRHAGLEGGGIVGKAPRRHGGGTSGAGVCQVALGGPAQRELRVRARGTGGGGD
mmetsp:Transcript_71341/g.201277  ORF Transcript_71341/g.201277 Transcript_71341/m.201277 type:complete len:418 (+) Transcript_71341:625-1878(+)